MTTKRFFDFWKLPAQDAALFAEPALPASSGLALYQIGGFHLLAGLFPAQAAPTSITATDDNGVVHVIASPDRDARQLFLAFDADRAIENLLLEVYISAESGHGLMSRLRRLFYMLKPLMPRPLQIALRRRVAASIQSKRTFPDYPLDTSVDALQRCLLEHALRLLPAHSSLPVLSFWPDGKQYALVLTHDVELQPGYDNLQALVDLERRLGFRSAWNFVPLRYKIDSQVLTGLQEEGFEIGVHGLYHDGKLFASYPGFIQRAAQINQYFKAWNSMGFRAPSAVRKLEWISQHLDACYDSSCPTSERYGAQPGGCCTIFPFMYNNLVELPITLQQDHALLEILGLSPQQMLEHWLQTTRRIKTLHGMALLITHPDYLLNHERRKAYEQFLQAMRQEETDCWFATPAQVAEWWRARQDSYLEQVNDQWVVRGPAAGRVRVQQASLKNNQLIIQ